MDARQALFDVYGDHLRARTGGQAPVAALLRLLAPLGVQAPAVRTAVSRMARQGWLTAVPLDAGPGYALTPRAEQRLDEDARHLYRRAEPWDGSWHLLVLSAPSARTEREHLHTRLRWLGYGPLSPGTWVAARPAPGLDEALTAAAATAHRFSASAEDGGADLVRAAWDLEALAVRYRRVLADARAELAAADTGSDGGAFAARTRLLQAWRAFLPLDPGLPAEVLPADWPGTTAAAWFDEHAARLLPAARRHVEHCLAPLPVPAQEGPAPCPRPSEQAPSRSTSPTASPSSPSPARRG